MSRPRVVITGLFAITPLGNDLETTWKRLLAGESGIGPITLFDATDYDSRVAGEVKDFVAEDFIPAKQARRMDRFTQFAVVAAQQLLKDSGLVINDDNAYDVGVIPGHRPGWPEDHRDLSRQAAAGWSRQGFSLPDPHAHLQHGPRPDRHLHRRQRPQHRDHHRLCLRHPRHRHRLQRDPAGPHQHGYHRRCGSHGDASGRGRLHGPEGPFQPLQ